MIVMEDEGTLTVTFCRVTSKRSVGDARPVSHGIGFRNTISKKSVKGKSINVKVKCVNNWVPATNKAK